MRQAVSPGLMIAAVVVVLVIVGIVAWARTRSPPLQPEPAGRVAPFDPSTPRPGGGQGFGR